MTTYLSNSLGSLANVAPDAVLYLRDAGTYGMILGGLDNAVVVSTGINTYTTKYYGLNSANSCVIQRIWAPLTGNNIPVNVVGTGTSLYDSAANVCQVDITPVYADSLVYVDFNITGTVSANTLFLNVYANQAGLTIDPSQERFFPSDPAITIGASGVGFVGGAIPVTFNLCVFRGTASGPIPTVGAPGDGLVVTEINRFHDVVGTNPMVVTQGTTPIVAGVIPSAPDTSVLINVKVYYIDLTNNVLSGCSTVMLMSQQVGSSTPTIAYNNVVISSTSPAPTLSFTPIPSGIEVTITGLAGTSFCCQFYVEIITS